MIATTRSLIFACLFTSPAVLFGQQASACRGLPSHVALRSMLQAVLVQPGQPNGGLPRVICLSTELGELAAGLMETD